MPAITGEFNAIDSENIELIKEAMAQKAIDGDAAAASAFAKILEAETNRTALLVKAAELELAPAAPPVSGWQAAVGGNKQPTPEGLAA